MSLKKLLGIEDVEMSDREIQERIDQASLRNERKIEFIKGDGSKVEISLAGPIDPNKVGGWGD